MSKSPPSSPLDNNRDDDATMETRAQQQALLASFYAQLGVLGQSNSSDMVQELLSIYSRTSLTNSSTDSVDKKAGSQPIRESGVNGK